ncbi:hypothetical protein [uncultured Jatrophihabitans sp.]|uniref:hypothetical protein n=1 Tax=uncultured Jatrophihabitans sp. TaxID=1610747 RepID=UPI0035CBBE46
MDIVDQLDKARSRHRAEDPSSNTALIVVTNVVGILLSGKVLLNFNSCSLPGRKSGDSRPCYYE